jgi:hypothetical protein
MTTFLVLVNLVDRLAASFSAGEQDAKLQADA